MSLAVTGAVVLIMVYIPVLLLRYAMPGLPQFVSGQFPFLSNHPILNYVVSFGVALALLVALGFLVRAIVYPRADRIPLLGPLGVLPLPTKWVIRVGAPVDLAGVGPDAARDELLLSRLTEDLRAEIQALVDGGLRERESVWS